MIRRPVVDAQFRTLTAHFFDRFFDRDSIAPDTDPHLRAVQLIALVSVPGLMFSFSRAMESGGGATLDRMWAQTANRCGFICYAMIVMGLIVAYKWDTLFPDRRDYLILTPRPISAKRLFAAKVTALLLFLGLFAIAINAFPLLIMPAVYAQEAASWSAYPQAVVAHAAGVGGGTAFMALSLAALQGVLINVLPAAAFRRISTRIRTALIAGLAMVFLILPLIRGSLRPLAEAGGGVLDYFPLIWFLGLYESLLPGGTPTPLAAAWARAAVYALAAAAAAFALSYGLGYRRFACQILESAEPEPSPPGRVARAARAVLDRTILRRPAERALFHFIDQVAGRSPQHRLWGALCLGLGLALAASSLFVLDRAAAFPFRLSPRGALEAPLILSFLTVTGLRAAFGLPYELGANWMFRLAGPSVRACAQAVWKWVLLRRVAPLYGVIALFTLAWLPPATAVLHLGFDLTVTALLARAVFLRFHQAPFACSYAPGKMQLALKAAAWLFAFTTFVSMAGGLKHWAVADASHMAAWMVAAGAGFAGLSLYQRRTGRTMRVVYEEAPAGLQSLDLS